MAKLNEVLRIVSLGGPTRQPSTYKKMTHMMMMNNRKTHLNMISTMCGCPWPWVAFGVLPDVIPKTRWRKKTLNVQTGDFWWSSKNDNRPEM